MTRRGILISAMLMMVASALPALANPVPVWPVPGPPAHAHMLILDSGKCIDLGHNQVLVRNAHHDHLHVGQAGTAQRATGHQVLPTAPIVLGGVLQPANCAARPAS